jgi:hypothetical protein
VRPGALQNHSCESRGRVNPNVLVAAITTAGSVAVSVTALVLAYRGMNSLERRMEIIESDLKQFYRTLAEHDKRIQRLEDKP